MIQLKWIVSVTLADLSHHQQGDVNGTRDIQKEAGQTNHWSPGSDEKGLLNGAHAAFSGMVSLTEAVEVLLAR